MYSSFKITKCLFHFLIIFRSSFGWQSPKKQLDMRRKSINIVNCESTPTLCSDISCGLRWDMPIFLFSNEICFRSKKMFSNFPFIFPDMLLRIFYVSTSQIFYNNNSDPSPESKCASSCYELTTSTVEKKNNRILNLLRKKFFKKLAFSLARVKST